MSDRIKALRRMLLTIIWMSIAVYGGLVALAFVAQGKLLFFPSKDIHRTPAENGWDFEEVVVDVGDNTTSGWYIHASPDPPGVILFSHGNAGNIADRLESIGIFHHLGYDVLIYDYGGYGQSTGRTTEKRCYNDIRAMWLYLTETRGVSPEKVVLFGRSLGAGVACQLATEVQAAAVILESTFTSVPDRAQEIYRILPAKIILTLRFDNASKIGRVKSPLLIVHSPDDTLIPYHHGQKLFKLAPEPKTFLEIRGDHNEGFWMSGATYTNGLKEFLDPLLIGE